MIKTIRFVKDRFSLLPKLKQLNIEKCGVDEDGDPFIKLKDGYIFYGLSPRVKDRKFYNLLSKDLKSKLPFECFRVAQDIVIRFVEGGLKYGGPKKNSIYEVKEGDTVAEMGAYMGYYSMKMASVVGDQGRCIAIEPMPNNLRLLYKNMEHNSLNNCTVVPCGVWNKKDELDFFRKEGDNQSGSALMKGENKEQLLIPVNSLDNILEENKVSHCNQMVIQLNGVEIEALEGLNKIIPENLAIAARYDRDGLNTMTHIQNQLKEKGYSSKVLSGRYIFATQAK